MIDSHSPDQRFPDIRETGDSTLRQCQLVMIRMLKILDHVCTTNGIDYWMTAGTLIGAIRHRGMIPWDGDIDLGITRPDLEKLKTVVGSFPESMFYQDHTTDPYYPKDVSMVKLRDRYSNYVAYAEANPESNWHNGLQVDLLIYDEDENGQLVNPVRGTAYPRSEIFPLTTLAFEGAQCKAPRNWHEYIRRRYGDYMQLPPPEARFAHEGRADPFHPCVHPASRPYPSTTD